MVSKLRIVWKQTVVEDEDDVGVVDGVTSVGGRVQNPTASSSYQATRGAHPDG